ncbi:MAG TPA: aminodeoxychorismate synthase component I [Longimicrobiales bacterium]|nr:aminodeoxychorismate synthase component I [Longimicrobiales bacterium]
MEPRVEEIAAAPAPAEACARFLDLPYCLLLESAAVSSRLGRYSFLTADPFLVLRSKGRVVEATGRSGTRRLDGDPFEALRAALAAFAAPPVAGLPPFQGGAAGYLGYDLLHHLERVPAPRFDDLALPDLCLGLFDWVLAWDHQAGRAWLVSTGLPAAESRERFVRAAARTAAVLERLDGPPRRSRPWPAAAHPVLPEARTTFPVPGLPGVASTFSRAGYLDVVARTREYILAGDIFQANLSQRLEAGWDAPPFALYERLRRRNPAPFAAYLDIGGAAVVSASPERFLRTSGGRVETRPIKGTAPRGITPMHDMALERALRVSEKDRAENVMIVDLLRNDLARVCLDHTVEVPELCVIERYPSVHHLVSTVHGRLRPELGPVDLLRAAFPGGSITGAPKVRAMEIIHELEPTRRSVYTGAIGYIGFDGTMDTSIAIRTFIVKGGTSYFQVGGAIVADSEPEREYLETLTKAAGLVAALEVEHGVVDR